MSRFWKVFLAVGEVAERVSSLKLVETLPKPAVTLEVLRLSLGLLEDDGEVGKALCRELWPQAIGLDGSKVTDMFLEGEGREA